MHDSTTSRNTLGVPHIAERPPKVLVLLGTRPEAIKLAPVIHELKRSGIETTVVSSSQHKDLLRPFLSSLDIKADHDLGVMKRNQTPNDVCSRVLAKLDPILSIEHPRMILVQGDTTTALAGALAGYNRRIPVGHVEAGLRSGNVMSPFPEEMNRRLVSQLATFHFAATEENRGNLLSEGIEGERIFVTGNPVVDSLHSTLKGLEPTQKIAELIADTKGKRRVLLTTHRRESFGPAMVRNLKALRSFTERHSDVALIFPVHPNPNVRTIARETLAGVENVYLLDPLDYSDFLALLRASWLIVSDSGGVQEEAPSLGKPLLVIRENTERPEAVSAGVAKLVGSRPGQLAHLLEACHSEDTWVASVKEIANPFGDGRAAERIVKIIGDKLAHKRPAKERPAKAERLAA